MEKEQTKARLIAFYLPQFHPIPENDRWWGTGFTEWTNVAKARPLFSGHYQPHVPADLGFYDLRVPETRLAQAEMARKYGVEGFCYWHYWFAGKRLLERPFNEVLNSGQPDFPFCLAWANQTWTGIWHGAPNRILMEQTYPGKQDYETHFYALLDAFGDERYIKVDGKPLFVVYNPLEIPVPRREFTDHWRELAVKAGLKGLYFVGKIDSRPWSPVKDGFDGTFMDILPLALSKIAKNGNGLAKTGKIFTKKAIRHLAELPQLKFLRKPFIYSYRDFVHAGFPRLSGEVNHFPSVMPNWDNTPRSGYNGIVFRNATPVLFRKHLQTAIKQIGHLENEKKIVFIKSWNEWAEGNYLEPDLKYGYEFLDAVKEVVFIE